jgi:hypothetical protein
VDALCEIVLECNLLEKIGSVWQKFYQSADSLDGQARVAFAKAVASSCVAPKFYCCYFGHVGILSNLLCEAMEKEGMKEVVEVSPLWKAFAEPNLETYNLMMMEVSSI